MTGHCGSLPLKYMQPIMFPTSSKSLVELSLDEHESTFVNITQMLSSLTCTPRYSEHPLLPQHNHLLLPQHPSKLQPKALQKQLAPSGRHLQLQMYNHQLAELMSHLTNLVMSVRHHNVLLIRCKYNHNDVTG